MSTAAALAVLTFKQFFAVCPHKIARDLDAAFVARAYRHPNNVCVVQLRDARGEEAIRDSLDGVCRKSLAIVLITENADEPPQTAGLAPLADVAAASFSTSGDIPTDRAALILLAHMQAAVLRHKHTSTTEAEHARLEDEIQRLAGTVASKQTAIDELRRKVLQMETARARPAARSLDACLELEARATRAETEVVNVRSASDKQIIEIEMDLFRKNEALVKAELALDACKVELAAAKMQAELRSADLVRKTAEAETLLERCVAKDAELELAQSSNDALAADVTALTEQLRRHNDHDERVRELEEHVCAINEYASKMDISAAREASRLETLRDRVSENSEAVQELLLHTVFAAGKDPLAIEQALAKARAMRERMRPAEGASDDDACASSGAFVASARSRRVRARSPSWSGVPSPFSVPSSPSRKRARKVLGFADKSESPPK